MLQLKHVYKTYKIGRQETIVLKDINLQLDNQQLVAILGPSGSGKTTLMNIIGALDSDFTGEVLVNNQSLQKHTAKAEDSYRRNTIGFVFQQFQLIPALSAQQNICLALELNGVAKSKQQSRALDLLAKVELADFAKKPVNQLSGGQKQRVAIARALANNPEIILADEPTGALDSETGKQIMELLHQLAKEKLVIVITHAEEIADNYADTIVRMSDGEIIAVEEKIREQQSVVALPDSPKKNGRMSLWSSVKYALRNLSMKRGRTAATTLGMSIGIFGIALALALSNGMSQTFSDQINQIIPTSNVTVSKDGAISYGELDAIMENENFSGYAIEPDFVLRPMAAGLDGVDLNGESDSVLHLHNDRPSETLSDSLYAGALPELPYEVVVSLNTAKTLVGEDGDINSLIGSHLNIFFNKQNSRFSPAETATVAFTISGITASETMGDSFYAPSNMTEHLLRDYFDVQVQELKFTEVTVYLSDSVTDAKTYLASLNESGDGYTYTGASEAILDTVAMILSYITYGLIALSSISILVALLMIGLVISISVIEKRQEIGIIRALGGSKGDIIRIFLSESLVIGLLAGIVGVVLTIGISQIINLVASSLIASALTAEVSFAVAQLPILYSIGLILVCMILGCIAGGVPAYSAAQLDPIESMKRK